MAQRKRKFQGMTVGINSGKYGKNIADAETLDEAKQMVAEWNCDYARIEYGSRGRYGLYPFEVCRSQSEATRRLAQLR